MACYLPFSGRVVAPVVLGAVGSSVARRPGRFNHESGPIMIDEKTGQLDQDHPHIRQLAQLRPDQLRGFAMRLEEISNELFDVARQPHAQARSLTGGGVPAWLVDLYNKFGPIVMDLLRAYFLREA